MFERNRIDNVDTAVAAVALTLDDGRTLNGRLAIGAGRSLYDALNGGASFLDFETYDGERALIAKHAVREVRPMNPPRAASLGGRLRDADGFDPLSILGLEAGATFETTKAAYHRLALIYHPDRYAGAELPGEVREYLDAMVRRINAAYEALESLHEARRQATSRQAPLYAPARSAMRSRSS